MRLWTMLCVVPVVLAGCSDGGAPPEPEDDPFAGLDDEPVPADKGLIRGVVIDPTVTPVEGVTVEILNQDLRATTTETGAFVFNGIEPGNYILRASKPGYSTIQSTALVEAGVKQPPIVRIQVERLPGTEPRAMTFEDVGFISCGWGVPITYGYCGEHLGAQDDYRLQYDVSGIPTTVQVEVIWRNTQPLSENLYMINALCPGENRDTCPGRIASGHRWDEGTKQSPAIMRTPGGFIEAAMERFGAPSMDGWLVGIDVSADGPALATGVTIDQEFTGYTTIFWNLEPEADWTFAQQGAYPVPPA